MKHYGTGNMQALQKDATGAIVWLTIASSTPGAQGHVNGLEADKLSADRKACPPRSCSIRRATLGALRRQPDPAHVRHR